MSEANVHSLPSRRAVASATASIPLAATAPAKACVAVRGDLPARCAEWLTLDLEIDRLSRRWSLLETQAVREFDWFKLSSAKRSALPMAAEMDDIDDRIQALFKERTKGLKALRRMKATDAHGAVSKLVVAARISQQDGGDVPAFLAEAIETLAAVKCPVCGAPCAPAPCPTA